MQTVNPIDQAMDHGLFRVEDILCPGCGSIQKATVVFTEPWFTYVHVCTNCAYTIMESEWEKIIPPENKTKKFMMTFFKDTWNWTMALIVIFTVSFMLIWTIGWSFEDGVLNLSPVWIGLGFLAFVYICTFISWLIGQKRKGDSHG